MTWPQYQVAPSDSVFALGVVSINYARFEVTQTWMLAAVSNIREHDAIIKAARVTPGERIKLIQSSMFQREWPKDVAKAIHHYLAAMDVLTTNRNLLIHSNMVGAWQNRTGLYSLSRKGVQSAFQTEMSEIRKVADDLNDYFWFGHALSNYIVSEIHFAAREEGMMVVSNLPDLLPMPVHIHPAKA